MDIYDKGGHLPHKAHEPNRFGTCCSLPLLTFFSLEKFTTVANALALESANEFNTFKRKIATCFIEIRMRLTHRKVVKNLLSGTITCKSDPKMECNNSTSNYFLDINF